MYNADRHIFSPSPLDLSASSWPISTSLDAAGEGIVTGGNAAAAVGVCGDIVTGGGGTEGITVNAVDVAPAWKKEVRTLSRIAWVEI